MNIYIYSDESGVFDYLHNDYFVFGGLICFGNDEKELAARKYSHVEKMLANSGKYSSGIELKAANISNADKGKMFRSMNGLFKFCVVIEQKRLDKKIFENKKHKQRYLDYAYKIVLKKCFQTMIEKGYLRSGVVDNILIYVDEHTTATDGRYELRENLLNEFKYGTFNPDWNIFYEPLFPKVKDVMVSFCDSSKTRLIRAADIIANHCYFEATKSGRRIGIEPNMFTYILPSKIIRSSGLEFFSSKSHSK